MKFVSLTLLACVVLTGCRSSTAIRQNPSSADAGVSGHADHEPSGRDPFPGVAGIDGTSAADDEASPASTLAGSTTHPVSLSVAGRSDDETPGRQRQSSPAVAEGALAVPVADEDVSFAIPPSGTLQLTDVIQSVHESYPLVRAAFQERQIAGGNQTAAWGEFDTKLKAASESQPLGYYETYRNSAGISKPLYGGGEVFGGYRIGDGDFEPWYKERETDEGGEFKGGFRVPLIRDRNIDARRAALWRSGYDVQIANPVIRASLIEFSREAGLAYWKWVASGQKVQVGRQWLEIAEGRNSAIERRVELQDLDPPELIDNRRAIAKREAKLADALREFQQAAAKLSLFYRDDQGQPVLPTSEQVPDFPSLRKVTQEQMVVDIERAQQARPELAAIDFQLQKLKVDYSEACNQTLPGLDAQLTGAQDVGTPASSKRDKSEFELEAGLYFDVPVQRRKGQGKMQATQSKMVQVAAKRRLLQEKIAAEVQAAYAGMIQSRQEALKAREAVQLAGRMAEIERRRFEVGDSDLLKVALREQYALEAAEEEIDATHGHFAALTDYAAILAIDRPREDLLPPDSEQL
ncbi:MAG: TolC family protein [Planctomycetaceae bacterium]